MQYLDLLQRLRYLLQPKRVAIAEACLIGLISGLAAVILQQGIGLLGSWRLQAAAQFPAAMAYGRSETIALPLIGLLGGLIAGTLVQRFGMETSGSGIPQVKAALAQFPVALNGRVAFVKLLASLTAIGAGLSLGRQGPTVQIGAALAAQLSYWVPTVPEHRRQMIAAGAGAGLAAGFNAPIAGVLFVAEELLHDLSSLTLGTAIVACFIGAVVARVLGGQSLSLSLEQVASQADFTVVDIPFLLFLGALAGLLGALFNSGILSGQVMKRRFFRVGLPLQVGLAGALSGLIVGLLPGGFQNYAGMRELLSTGALGWQTSAIAFALQFGLTILAFSSGAPGGLFAPSLLMGAALGNVVGGMQAIVLDTGDPTTYALVGMGAFFGAVSRVPFTGIVIIFEMTTDFNLVLPLMICSIVAYWVAERVKPGSIYDLLLRAQGIDLQAEPNAAQGPLTSLTAADIMERRVETLTSEIPMSQVAQAFARSQHRGFPILAQGHLVGIVTQSDLTKAQQRQLSDQTPVREMMTPSPVTVNPHALLSEVLYLLDRYKISRLPVMEGRKMVGVITRADIIRAETVQLSGKQSFLKPASPPSYVVFQTRAPAVAERRMLIALGNPNTAETLMRLAVALTQDRSYELECLQVIEISRNRIPSETAVRTEKGRHLLQRSFRYGKRQQIPVHTQIRVAHDVGQTILEVEKERHIDLILMGWQGRATPHGWILGDTTETVTRQAASDVIFVKSSAAFSSGRAERWLIPVSGGPNIQQALQFLPALLTLGQQPDIYLCQVVTPQHPQPNFSVLEAYTERLQAQFPGQVRIIPLVHSDVAAAIVELAATKDIDVIMLGASREGLLHQVLHGNIPTVIAQASSCAVLLVRAHSTAELS
ncbi:universal stress protein [Synechococcales cyanobacterium C]|uniref:Universal stress protein n=1 Tax=Petrachloros mirabilis ULC683 TaxID=2781853 RepID=A0A8K1ZWY4_9CYAN|nr:chloride channel protein [Petrachloros mirabilis]NCJ05393.1 universal stress protein [Petrachloros mirabilis ULC683]